MSMAKFTMLWRISIPIGVRIAPIVREVAIAIETTRPPLSGGGEPTHKCRKSGGAPLRSWNAALRAFGRAHGSRSLR